MWWEEIIRFLLHNPGFTIIGAFTLIQIVPIKINPWSWVATLIHKFLFGKIDEKLDSISKKVDDLEAKTDKHNAVLARTHILRFSDEIQNDVRHSQEYFRQQLLDIDTYDQYCEAHPEFQNSYAVLASKHIKATYEKLLEKGEFKL